MPHDDDRGAQRRFNAMPLAVQSFHDIYQSPEVWLALTCREIASLPDTRHQAIFVGDVTFSLPPSTFNRQWPSLDNLSNHSNHYKLPD